LTKSILKIAIEYHQPTSRIFKMPSMSGILWKYDNSYFVKLLANGNIDSCDEFKKS